jgi:hypothetical protein
LVRLAILLPQRLEPLGLEVQGVHVLYGTGTADTTAHYGYGTHSAIKDKRGESCD